MSVEDIHIAHLTNVIDHLKVSIAAALRGYEQAIEELGAEGDLRGKDWSEPYNFLKKRVAALRALGGKET
jgi:hypothetical protein